MAYITQDDLQNQISERRLIELTDDAKAGNIDGEKVSQAIDDAQSEVDGYLASRYSIPVATPPALLKNLTSTIAVYKLYLRRGQVPESIRRAYDDARATLKDIAKGLADLPIETPAVASGGVEYTGPDRIFTRDTLGSF